MREIFMELSLDNQKNLLINARRFQASRAEGKKEERLVRDCGAGKLVPYGSESGA